MSVEIVNLFRDGGGDFVSPPSVFIEKLKKIKAVLFDWDGVFNDGFKRGSEGSIFSEIDAMGTNLLRYSLYRKNGVLPITAIITGENNPVSEALAKRERYHALYFLSKHKLVVFNSFCEKYALKPEEVLFFFDDVLDFEVARKCGTRIMIGRKGNPMLKKNARENSLVDYVTGQDGGNHGLREGCELVMGLLGFYDSTAKDRSTFSAEYQAYLGERLKVEPLITEQKISV